MTEEQEKLLDISIELGKLANQADKLYLVTTVLPLITDSLDFICDGMANVSNSLVQNQPEAHE